GQVDRGGLAGTAQEERQLHAVTAVEHAELLEAVEAGDGVELVTRQHVVGADVEGALLAGLHDAVDGDVDVLQVTADRTLEGHADAEQLVAVDVSLARTACRLEGDVLVHAVRHEVRVGLVVKFVDGVGAGAAAGDDEGAVGHRRAVLPDLAVLLDAVATAPAVPVDGVRLCCVGKADLAEVVAGVEADADRTRTGTA